jgi:hypothetical protein
VGSQTPSSDVCANALVETQSTTIKYWKTLIIDDLQSTYRYTAIVIKEKTPKPTYVRFGVLRKMATTYSPTFWCSTIGAEGLNFSVRNGKR